ncbi:hypothetical protein KSS87_005020 [Heliosperma pusillum]|nr:hypothetical protein KSS87_005020 [Heliosperma pusillum]
MAPFDPFPDPCKEALRHGMTLDPSNTRIQCCYCGKVVPSVNRLQHHLGGIRGNTIECPDVPEVVKDYFRNSLLVAKVDRLVKEVGDLNQHSPPSKRRCTSNGNISEVCSGSSSKRFTTNGNILEACSSSKEGMNIAFNERKRCIGRFFFENAIDFSAVKSPSFQSMLGIFPRNGEGLHCIPSIPELSGWILEDELKDIENYVNQVKLSWAQTGCSILLDGWTDQSGRNLINVVVDCPAGPIYHCSADVSPSKGANTLQLFLESVLQEVGVQNVVQIVAHTYSDSLEALSQLFIDKYITLFWSVSGTHCISLILDKIAGCNQIKTTLEKAKTITQFIYSRSTVLKLLRRHIGSRDLVIPSKIKAATPFLTLENFLEERDNLEYMFTSSEWLASHWGSSSEGKMVAHLIGDSSFWDEIVTAVKASIPLVKALSLINGDGGPHTGFIYETMDQIKETISEEFGGKKSRYNQYWAMIDEIWNPILHSPLHAAGYFLNPRLYYTEDFFTDSEVASGLLVTFVKMLDGRPSQDRVTDQIEKYGRRDGDFQLGISTKDSLSPAAWWSRYGSHCPQLQKIAIRILSQTCNGAESYELRRDLAEKLLSYTGKNAVEQQKLHDLTYLNYNLKLKQCKLGPKFDIVADQIDPTDDWINDGLCHAEPIGLENGSHVGLSNHVKLERGEPSGILPKMEPKRET